MNWDKRNIERELNQIRRLMELMSAQQGNEACGSLGLIDKGNSIYCYERLRDSEKGSRKHYLGKPDSDAVKKHCSAKYRRELLRRLSANKSLLENLMSVYRSLDPASVIASLPSSYGRIMNGAFLDERYERLKAWAAADYKKNTVAYPKAVQTTKNGVRVRSKGECIEYNLLLEAGIPFRYDSVIRISDANGYSKSLSPDFLIQCYDGSYVIIEHLGMISDKSYALDYGEKCYWYLQEGFIPGKNFLVTSDDVNGGTDSEAIAAVILRVEELFWGL